MHLVATISSFFFAQALSKANPSPPGCGAKGLCDLSNIADLPATGLADMLVRTFSILMMPSTMASVLSC